MFPSRTRSRLIAAGFSEYEVNAIQDAICDTTREIIELFRAEFRRWHAYLAWYMLAQIGVVILFLLFTQFGGFALPSPFVTRTGFQNTDQARSVSDLAPPPSIRGRLWESRNRTNESPSHLTCSIDLLGLAVDEHSTEKSDVESMFDSPRLGAGAASVTRRTRHPKISLVYEYCDLQRASPCAEARAHTVLFHERAPPYAQVGLNGWPSTSERPHTPGLDGLFPRLPMSPAVATCCDRCH